MGFAHNFGQRSPHFDVMGFAHSNVDLLVGSRFVPTSTGSLDLRLPRFNGFRSHPRENSIPAAVVQASWRRRREGGMDMKDVLFEER